jgi:ferredoxin
LLRSAADNPDFSMTTCYSKPLGTDQLGRDFDHRGRLDINLVRATLDSLNAEFYLCGPGELMKSLADGLTALGVPQRDVRFEAFGPSTVKRAVRRRKSAPRADSPAAIKVCFAGSDKTVSWEPTCSTLLECAEDNDVAIQSGCRTGNCGSCRAVIRSGTVEYVVEPAAACDEGACLPCICVPAEDIVLDV